MALLAVALSSGEKLVSECLDEGLSFVSGGSDEFVSHVEQRQLLVG